MKKLKSGIRLGKNSGEDTTLVLQKPRNIVSRKNSNGSVAILKLDDDEHFFALEGLAAEFWEKIDGKKSRSAIEKSMLKKHSLPEERFRKDLNRLVKELRSADLLK